MRFFYCCSCGCNISRTTYIFTWSNECQQTHRCLYRIVKMYEFAVRKIALKFISILKNRYPFMHKIGCCCCCHRCSFRLCTLHVHRTVVQCTFPCLSPNIYFGFYVELIKFYVFAFDLMKTGTRTDSNEIMFMCIRLWFLVVCCHA